MTLYDAQARLRWRIADKGALSLWYDLERPHKIIEHAVSELTRQIEERSGMVTVNGVRRGSA